MEYTERSYERRLTLSSHHNQTHSSRSMQRIDTPEGAILLPRPRFTRTRPYNALEAANPGFVRRTAAHWLCRRPKPEPSARDLLLSLMHQPPTNPTRVSRHCLTPPLSCDAYPGRTLQNCCNDLATNVFLCSLHILNLIQRSLVISPFDHADGCDNRYMQPIGMSKDSDGRIGSPAWFPGNIP